MEIKQIRALRRRLFPGVARMLIEHKDKLTAFTVGVRISTRNTARSTSFSGESAKMPRLPREAMNALRMFSSSMGASTKASSMGAVGKPFLSSR